MKLHHLHLPGPTPYLHASHLQDRLVRSILNAKASKIPPLDPYTPTIITFTPPPTYTTGRRDTGLLTPPQIQHLLAHDHPLGPAAFHEALRGGQTTYHGPGQLVAYPILSLLHHHLTARRYIHLLEEAVMGTCARFGVSTMRTENPGVWTRRSGGEEKICAVGVHLRRNVSAHGVGLNVGVGPLGWLGRIVACGLEGKGASALEREMEGGEKERLGWGSEGEGEGWGERQVGVVGRVFVEEIVKGLEGVEGVVGIGEGDLPP